MVLLRIAAVMLCLGVSAVLAVPAGAQPAASSSAAVELASLMSERGLDAFAAEGPEGSNSFMATLLLPKVQLLVVSADYPVPDELKAQLAHKNYRDVYTALHQPVSAATRFFLIDLDCDGLSPKGGASDILFEQGRVQTVFNGDWKAQGLSESAYRKRLEDAERRYSQLLETLKGALKATTE
jgi:hypothetical protein